MAILHWTEEQAWHDFSEHLNKHRNIFMPSEKESNCLNGDIQTIQHLIERLLEQERE